MMPPDGSDPFDIVFVMNRTEARSRAERAYTAASTPTGLDIDRLCDVCADLLAEQIATVHRTCDDLEVTNEAVRHQLEEEIVTTFQDRLRELMDGSTLAGRA